MADRYWVGGTANWDGTAGTKWATTSGGAGGAAVPTSADNVFFDANSGANTVTVGATVNCADLTFTGFTGTLAGTEIIQIYGSLTAVAGMTWNFTGTIFFLATSTGKTITADGKLSNVSQIRFDGLNGEWTLQDTLSCKEIKLYAGTFITNNKNITCTEFTLDNVGASLTGGTLTLGSSTVTINASNPIGFDSRAGTINAGTSKIIVNAGTYSTAVFNISKSYTFYDVEVYGNSGVIQIVYNGASTYFNNLKLAPTVSGGEILLYANIEITNTFTCTGTNVGNRIFVYSNVRGTQRIISAATVSIQDTDFRSIDAAGASSPWNLSAQRVGNLGGNTDITFPTPVTRYAVTAGNWGSTLTWSASSGGPNGASVPLPQDTAIFDASTGAGTYTINVARVGPINASALGARTISLANSIEVYGDFILSAAMTFTPGSNSVSLLGLGAKTVNSAGKSFKRLSISGDYTFASNITCTNELQIFGSTVDANGYNVNASYVTAGYYYLDSSAVVAPTIYMGSGTWTVSSSEFNCWEAPSSIAGSATIFAQTSTININATTSTTTIFIAGGKTYNNLTISGSTGATVIWFPDNGTFNTLATTKTNAFTLRFTAGKTTTVQNVSVIGSVGNLITLESNSAGSRFNIAKSSGGVVVFYFVSVKDSNATTANTFYAVNSTNAGNNVNWSFNFPPSLGNMMAFFN